MIGEGTGDLLREVGAALDLEAMLDVLLGEGLRRLGWQRASAYLFAPASGRLELRRMRGCDAPHDLSFAPGEGVVGQTWQSGRWKLASGDELEGAFVGRGPWVLRPGHRAVLAVPCVDEGVGGVLCFDRLALAGEACPLDVAAVAEVAAALSDGHMARALRRARTVHGLERIRAAGSAQYLLRAELGRFLADFLSAFAPAGRPAPDMANVQLVDRRLDVVRTILGFGMPLSCQVSISHPLGSGDIQAHVARTGAVEVLAGDDPRFDLGVAERYGHGRYVRLFLPLFPFPLARATDWGARPLESALSEVLAWEPPERSIARLRLATRWPTALQPPEMLVFGTLEVGYRMEGQSLDLGPWDPDLVTFCLARAYERVDDLFRATLPGALDTIAREVANLAQGTAVAVRLPDRCRQERRVFPSDWAWPAVVPRVETAPVAPGTGPVNFVFEPDAPRGLREKVERVAEESVRVALRLDDQLADAFSLIDRERKPARLETRRPNPFLHGFCADVAREAGAVCCRLFLFEWEEQLARERRLRLVSPPASSLPRQEQLRGRVPGRDRARSVAETGRTDPGRPDSVVYIPLEIGAEAVGVLELTFPDGQHTAADRYALEGRVVRWVHRLALGQLVAAARFEQVVSALRRRVARARAELGGTADGGDGARHTARFARRLLGGIEEELTSEGSQVLAALLTLVPSAALTPEVERFFLSGGFFASHRDPARQPGSACQRAIGKGAVLVYPPGHRDRVRDTGGVSSQIEQMACAQDGDARSALLRIAALARGDGGTSTMLVVPAVLPTTRPGRMDAALTILIEGEHHFAPSQRRMLAEVGTLVASVLEDAQEREARWLSDQLEHGEGWRVGLERAESVDEVLDAVSAAFQDIRVPAESGELQALGPAGVVWLISRGFDELVPRVAWGGAAQDLALVPISPTGHPVLRDLHARITRAKKGGPRLAPADAFWTVDLSHDRSDGASWLGKLRAGSWLTSIPVVGTQDEFVGLIDLVRESRLLPEIDQPLLGLARRMGRWVVMQLERSHLRSWVRDARRVNAEAPPLLKSYQVEAVWQSLARACQEALGCAGCDLYYDLAGDVVLRGTTREPGPRAARPQDLRIRAKIGPEPVGDCLAARRPAIVRAGRRLTDRELEHVSPDLRCVIQGDSERLIVPLPDEGSQSRRSAGGAIVAFGPFSHGAGIESQATWSRCADEQDLRLALGLARVVDRVAKMARVVEEQSVLVNEMVHALAHPLQHLRGLTDDLLEGHVESGLQRETKRQLDAAYALFEDCRDQLGYMVKLGQTGHPGQAERCSPSKLLAECCWTWRGEASRRGVRIVRNEADRGLSIRGYPRWLRLALSNLIHNAVKYSFRQRDVTVDLAQEGAFAVLTVTNSGVGIPRDDREHVFDLYFRSQVPDARGERQGMGVGLAVTKEAIRLHGGTISFESAPRHGRTVGPAASDIENVEHTTVFSIRLPLEKAP